MFVMTTVTYPPDKTVEVVKVFTKAEETPLPSFLKRQHVLTTTAGESGLRTYGIYEVEAGKEYEGLQEISKRMVAFFGIAGFRYRVEPAMTPEESIPMLGL